MPTQTEVFDSIVASAKTGADSEGVNLDESAIAALNLRYWAWIVTPGSDELGLPVEPTPQELWDTAQGAVLRRRFEEIGRLAAQQAIASGKSEVDGVETAGASQRVESDSDCPWCR